MIFYQIDAGGDRNFAYLIGDEDSGSAALFDPPPDESRYTHYLAKHSLTVQYVILTHGHGDHTWGVPDAKGNTGAKVIAHELNPISADVRVGDNDERPLGSLTLRFIHTPGHTDDSMCILCDNKLITGDTLFVGKVGGTDYGEGARKEYESLHKKLKVLSDDIEVYPGHDYGDRPSSTMAHEKKTNPTLVCSTLKEFEMIP